MTMAATMAILSLFSLCSFRARARRFVVQNGSKTVP